ncbi:uncharacterized protein LOC110736028 [Chenopodium quinoa]|uniref:Uncharacterized protein n=1 Tax=Chenopodium quinoa TaxID=63459 RepID=A0A803KN99_CHEQI|nr:uncharacterized protein LOC110736028 [Chenopodium quinoa]
MAISEDSKAGICYIWVISSLLLIFTVSGAVFLVLYMIQPAYLDTSLYPVIGGSLVCFPWFFWFLTLVYRIVSRACGFRMSCFGSSGADHPDDAVPSGVSARNSNGDGVSPIQIVSTGTSNGVVDGGNGSNVDLENGSGNENENRASGVVVQPGSPRRVHFGGVVVLGEDDEGAPEIQESPKSLSSSSSSSSPLTDINESEKPLKLYMAS